MSTTDRDVAFLLGLPFHVITMDETIDDAVTHIERGKPGYYITANADFIAQAYNNETLKDILFHADRVVCDGMPLVWLSRYFKPDLPERVAGSDMVFRLFSEASKRKWRVFFLGSDEETLGQAKGILEKDYPDMDLVGTFSPPFGTVESWPNQEILEQVNKSKPDLLLVAVGCPKQEYWIARYYKESGIPLSIGIGASLDFITGTQTRAPIWVQKVGMEWMWRLATNPKRLLKRYVKDFYYLIILANRQRKLTQARPVDRDSTPRFQEEAMPVQPSLSDAEKQANDCHWITWRGEVERGTLESFPVPPAYDRPVFLDVSAVSFIDSSGIGLMAKLARDAKAAGHEFGLIHPSETVEKVVKAMHLDAQFPFYHDQREALDFLRSKPDSTEPRNEKYVKLPSPFGRREHLDCLEVLNRAVEDIDSGDVLVLDLIDLDMLDSFAISRLLSAYRELHARDAVLRLVNPNEQASQTMRMTGIYRLLVEGRALG